MEYRNMKYNVKERFKRNNICPICKKAIDKNSLFEYIVVTSAQFKIYNFFHRQCLIEKGAI